MPVSPSTTVPPPPLTTEITVSPIVDDTQQIPREFELPVHEEGWMPKPAILHAGKSRSCAVCHASLQYSIVSSWDEYLKSEEYLNHLQINLLNDTFIRGLICGENYFGDLPTEHRMHPQRRAKCRQNVNDHSSMNSAGLLDSSDKDKSLVRTLEELLIDGLPTPTFTYVLERRFAVIFHSAKIVSTLMKSVRTQNLPRPLADATPHVELHHVAIRALSTLLTYFDYSQKNALIPFQEMTRMLANFPPLSLLTFWSPPPKAPEQQVILSNELLSASNNALQHPPHSVIDSSDAAYWLSTARPGLVFFSIAAPSEKSPAITSIRVKWLGTSQPSSIAIQSKPQGSQTFSVVKEFTSKPSNPFPERLELPSITDWSELRLVLSGIPLTNKDATYGIIQLSLYSPMEENLPPQSVMQDIESWLVKATYTTDEVSLEACGALRAWALATGSLTALLRFVEMVLALRDASTSQTLRQLAVDEGVRVVDALQNHQETEILRIQQIQPTTESRKIRAGFESTLCSTGTMIEDGGQTVRTRETSYQHAVVNAPISSGKASWKFRLDTDTVDDEMTCFGAAILPVTVSGYDSSPSLWMLRGYNGNLYARGHKLSRSIGKVHPGDIIQMDVDMNMGTMSYTINATEYGVVFTDLCGHEVYPAVSFYGSGKVITLLSLHKWGDASNPMSTISDPIYLSTLSEYEHYVGHGRFGRGNLLGYTGESNSNETNQPSSTISVRGESKQRSLSIHPPARGEAFVTYDLGRSYASITGSVALNDDVSNENLAQRGISVVFSVVGDSSVLWKSKPLTTSTQLEAFQVPISQVRMLELRVSCSGSNHGAHAIWVDPHLIVVDDWSCTECSFLNKGINSKCAVCQRTSTNSATSNTVLPLGEDSLVNQDPIKLLAAKDELIHASHPLDEVSTTILASANDLAKALLNSPPYQVQFEEAFCFQPHSLTLKCLISMIEAHLSQLQTIGNDDSRRQSLALRRCQLLLGTLGRQLHLLNVYETPTSDGISLQVVHGIRTLLESLAHVHVSNPMSPAKSKAWLPPQFKLAPSFASLQTTAAQTLIEGLNLLYPASWDRTTLLLTLLRSFSQDKFAPTSARYLILLRLLSLLALPGDMGVLTFFPLVPDRLHSSQVQEIMKHLLSEPANTPDLARESIACVQTFQLFLLSQAIELTKTPSDSYRIVIQEMTMRYSELLLETVRQSLETSLDGDTLTTISPMIKSLLPQFVSGLSLLRRQTWLVRPLLPKLTMVLRVLDIVCGQDEDVRKSERRLLALDRRLSSYAMDVDDIGKWQVDKSPRRVQKQLYNVFSKLYTGEKDHFEGQIGFQFEAMATFTLVALGRSVNLSRNSGKLLHKHTIRLWDEASQALLGSITVGPSSQSDSMGYVFEYLLTPIRLSHGKLYRLTTQEFANGGDPWYKKENLPDEEYDTSFIKILRDCYASGSTGFPNSQNLTGAAYGVPTFLVEEDNPMDTLPSVIPMDGSLSLKFNSKRKSPSIAIGHLGNTLTVLGESGLWRTVWCTSAITCGVHVIEMIIKSSRVGGGVSGHVCIGFECDIADMPLSNAFLGQAPCSVGYMPSIGCFWNQGEFIPLGKKIAVHSGDIFAMKIDYDKNSLSFSHNGQETGSIGIKLPLSCVPGVSVYGLHDVVDVRPGGISKSTLQLHWLLDVLNTTASLAGRFAGTIISGPPIDGVEEELQPWLQSKLLSGGLNDHTSSNNHSNLLSWAAVMKREGSFQNTRYNISTEKPPQLQKRKNSNLNPLQDIVFGHSLPSVTPHIIQWLEKMLPDSLMWRRQETYPQVETVMCAALIKHAPPHVLQEAKAVVESKEINLKPSKDMTQVWKCILTLRHWLIKSKHEYRAKEDSASNSPRNLSNWEQKLSLPQSFEAFLDQVKTRAAFLCNLEPPTGEPNRWSHLALSNLAEKWSAEQPPPPSLQPMVDRWRSLSESDRSKWNGLVQVLQAQHKWRIRRKEETQDDEEGHDDYRYLSAMLRACDLYVRNGVGAPPEVLYALLDRRYARSESRIFGLEAIKTILNCISFDTARYGALLFLRPALRGFTEEEKLSRETYQEPLEGSFRPTVRHHYLKGLEGCNNGVLSQVQESFMDLYTFLAQLLSKTTASSSLVLQQSLIAAWTLDFEPLDHEFLLQVDILGLLTKIFSVSTLSQQARSDIQPLKTKRTIVTEWHPLAEEYTRRGLLAKGTLTKRTVLRVMQQAPKYANASDLTGVGTFKHIVSKHTASSMVLAYSDFLRHLHAKLKWCRPFDLGRKVLQLNLGEDVSIVEFPALPAPPMQSSFCVELWFYAMELQGYSTLRSEVGFADGGVHIELVDNRLQVAIAGNMPREQLFEHPFTSFTWHHVAILYDHEKQVVDLIVNGQWKEQLLYVKTCAKVYWRSSRLGSWISDLSSTVVQRKFKGLLAELRVWHHSRSMYDIKTSYQRSAPWKKAGFISYTWHLDDGEGELAVCAEMTNFNALITKCHWTRMNLPVWSESVATAQQWQRVCLSFQTLQKRYRKWRQKQWIKEVDEIKQSIRSEEYHEDNWVLSDDEDSAINEIQAAPTVVTDVGRLQLQKTAWIVFKLIGIVAISGIRERVEVEAVQAAISAKKRRLDKDKRDYQKTVDAASDVAKSAATSTALEIPVAQRLWFSIELHRKVFDGIERELASATKLIHDAEKLIRAQQPSMLRSMSTPVQQMNQEAAPLEPLEVEAYVYNMLLFLISQSDTYPAQEHISKPAVLRELLLLLRMGSPRAQRLVQLLLRRVASVVNPSHIATILGSDTVFLDLLLDRVSDSIGSDAEPISQSSMRESLANPLGFNTGQIFLALAAESVALLRILLREPAWHSRVSEVLSAAIRKAAPVVTQVGNPNLRTRVIVLRAMGALCVLGAHLDCLRIGGKVEVQSPNDVPNVATLISRQLETARVVFDDGSKVQEVKLDAMYPIEEIPSHVDGNVAELMPTLLHFATLEDDSLWRAQLRSRALLALESFLKQDHLLASQSLVQTALTPLRLPCFVTISSLQERSRSILSRLIEAATPIGSMMFRGLPDPTPIRVEKSDTPSASTSAPPPPPVSSVRQGFAATIAAMGFEMDLCLVALEHSRDDPNAAVEWLMGDQAVAYRRSQMMTSSASSFRALNDTTREEKARDLQLISGMPKKLVLAALEVCSNDANRAVEWLLEHGRRFSTSLNLSGDTFCQDVSDLQDTAALEVADQSDTLLFEPAVNLHDSRSLESSGESDNSLMTATLAPIVARDPKNGWGALDANYLPSNLVLTISEVVGPVAQLARSGTVVRQHPVHGVLMSFLNTENGALEEEYVCPSRIKRWSKVFDQELVAVDSIYDVALRTEQALSTCYARRAILALLGSESSTVLELMGGPVSFVQLLKLVVGASFVKGGAGKPKSVQENMVRILKDHPTLSNLLVEECITHFIESTQIAREGKVTNPLQFESLHPYYHKSDYLAQVSVPPQTPIPVRLVFDKRSCLLSKSTLTFYSDVDCKQVISSFCASNVFSDLWIPARSFWYKFHANEESEVTTYGFRFQVHLLPNITWSNEHEVLHQPSLDYACWLLEFLLSDPPLLHNHYIKVYDALVQYLQSPRAPQKHKVIHLLLQLLVKYSTSSLDIEPLQRIGELAISKAQAEILKGHPFVSSHLLKLVELAVVVSYQNSGGPFIAPIAPPIVVPTEAGSLLPIIGETVHLAQFLLDKNHQLPQELAVLIWLDMLGSSSTLESSTSCSGTLDFTGAHSLRVCLDPRYNVRNQLQLEVGTKTDDGLNEALFSPLVVAEVMDVVGNCLRYNYTATGDDDAKLSIGVTAIGMSLERQLARCNLEDLKQCAINLKLGEWTTAMDAQLVDWVNVHVENQGEGLHADLLPSDIRLHPTLDGLRCSLLLHLPWSMIQLRYALLRCFNTRLSGCISLFNLKDAEYEWTIAHQLRQLSHCVFLDLKLKLVEAAIDATVVAADSTNVNNGTARITLDRLRALESREDREVEPSASECFFAQAFRQLHSVDTKTLRRKIDSKGRLFSVKFRGEEGVDWGGVYREGTNSMVDDLFAAHFNLFLLCPNGQHNTGLHRGMYLPNSKCTSPVAIQMFEFVGKLLGVSLRTKGDFPFAFCPLVWKCILGQKLDKLDLEGTDALLVQMLDGIRNCQQDGITTQEQFQCAFADLELRFTTFDSNGQLVELVPSGQLKAVTFENRIEYCNMVELYRLHEFDIQCHAIVRGLSTLFPIRVLTLLNWYEMEMLSCGSPKIDINIWKQHTRYDGYTEQDETVRLFWEVMSSFSDEQRSDFVRFAWGRSRLPRGKWPQPFKLTKKAGRDSTLSLPVAHTCFFSVELPPYTTKQKMHDMLLATINFGLGGILIA